MEPDKIICGDNVTVLRGLPEACVDTCVTSPPYYGLRDYGVAGQIGLESTPEQYVARLVEVFREVRRVLKDDGTLWLNLGDSYAASSGTLGRNDSQRLRDGVGNGHGGGRAENMTGRQGTHKRMMEGLKSKDLIGIPWLVAFALRADGWYLRSDIIWNKPNPMPESVTDRPTKSHEYIFLLSKNERYYYDAAAIAEPKAYSTVSDARGNGNGHRRERDYPGAQTNGGTNLGGPEGSRNKRSVWTIDEEEFVQFLKWKAEQPKNKMDVWDVSTKPYKEAHFATFPPDLIKPCILAGSRPGGVVLDPFFGSGTTGFVAREFGRHFIGIELNPEYVRLAERRTARANVALFT